MKLAIIGSRTFDQYDLLERTLKLHFYDNLCGYLFDEIISGGAKGADSLAARWVKEHGKSDHVTLTEFRPDWEGKGRAAGFIRNEDIVSAADFLLAFWGMSPDGKELSRGTANSLSIAKRLKKSTLIVYF